MRVAMALWKLPVLIGEELGKFLDREVMLVKGIYCAHFITDLP